MAQTPQTAEEIVASVESGGRQLSGWPMKLVLAIAFSWSVFQLYIASAIPFFLSEHLGLKLVFKTKRHAKSIWPLRLCWRCCRFRCSKGHPKPLFQYTIMSLRLLVLWFVCICFSTNRRLRIGRVCPPRWI